MPAREAQITPVGDRPFGSSGWAIALGAGAEVCAFALLAEQAEELDRSGSGGAEPVRRGGVELGRFAGCEHDVMLSEHEP
jgi:hypothetical protein